MDKQTAKLIARIAENLPDMPCYVMQGWIENPNGLKKFLSGLSPSKSDFKVWKTIKLGTGMKNARQFRLAIVKAGGKVGGVATDILGNPAFTVATEEVELDLVNVSVGELGFAKGATRREIYKRAIELGLERCPAEVGPQLRLQYKDQPMGKLLLIGMEPISDSGGYLDVFYVERSGDGLWLYCCNGYPDYVWDPDSRWVFVQPRK